MVTAPKKETRPAEVLARRNEVWNAQSRKIGINTSQERGRFARDTVEDRHMKLRSGNYPHGRK